KDKRMIVVMPEGESNWDGITLPTVASTGKLFRVMKVPVHPVIIHNGYLALPRWASYPRTAKVYVEFRQPLSFTPEMTDTEVAEAVDCAIRWDPALESPHNLPRRVVSFRPAQKITRLIFRCPNCGESDGLEEIRWRYLACQRCSEKWRVKGNATLVNTRTGERRNSTEVFREICQMPRPVLDFGDQGKGLIRTPNIPVYKETEYPQYELLGRFDCLLREDRIDFLPREGQRAITIMLSELQSLSNELKKKCQLRTAEDMYQLLFERGSSLQWQIYVKDLLPRLDDRLIRPTNFATGHAPA
ncbi:MAG: hypothetical protein ACETWG_06900, partial [Candidatus Neomarinimicrobiota bacterium]